MTQPTQTAPPPDLLAQSPEWQAGFIQGKAQGAQEAFEQADRMLEQSLGVMRGEK